MNAFLKGKNHTYFKLTKKSQFAYKLKTPFDYITLFNGEFAGANSDAKGANSDVKGSMCKHAWLT